MSKGRKAIGSCEPRLPRFGRNVLCGVCGQPVRSGRQGEHQACERELDRRELEAARAKGGDR